MDTSKKYIEMCKKAKQIQEQRHVATDWEKGDWFLRASTPWVEVVSHRTNFSNLPIPVGTIYLPRQDQLQEMLQPIGIYDLIWGFQNWWLETDPSKQNLYTMEQLWFAFVMRQKYNKIWNGKDWINATKT